MSITANRKDFGLDSERACVVGLKNKDKYMSYQDEYREKFGVFPELDKINNPFCAPWSDVYEVYKSLQKRGFYGAWCYHDLHGYFNKRLRGIYEEYRNEWSFLISVDYSYRSYFDDIQQMSPQKSIVNNLGFVKDENGNYLEGTWVDDKLIYGLVYVAETNSVFVGRFDKDGLAYGVEMTKVETKNDLKVETVIGTYKSNKDCFQLYDSICLNIETVVKKRKDKTGEIETVTAVIGKYVQGYAEGRFYLKEISNDIRIRWDKYKDGEIKSSMKLGINMIPRIYIAILMMMYFMLKFTYGWLIFPIYRSIQKKNWR